MVHLVCIAMLFHMVICLENHRDITTSRWLISFFESFDHISLLPFMLWWPLRLPSHLAQQCMLCIHLGVMWHVITSPHLTYLFLPTKSSINKNPFKTHLRQSEYAWLILMPLITAPSWHYLNISSAHRPCSPHVVSSAHNDLSSWQRGYAFWLSDPPQLCIISPFTIAICSVQEYPTWPNTVLCVNWFVVWLFLVYPEMVEVVKIYHQQRQKYIRLMLWKYGPHSVDYIIKHIFFTYWGQSNMADISQTMFSTTILPKVGHF